MQRVISNLLENASKFTPQAGRSGCMPNLTCGSAASLSKTGVTGDGGGSRCTAPNAVKVSVSDTGPGIPPEFHLEIFDDFFRLPGSEAAEGMGLGLAIARRLLNGMGGKIWVESEPGAGCKFSFLIPLKPILNSPRTGKGKPK